MFEEFGKAELFEMYFDCNEEVIDDVFEEDSIIIQILISEFVKAVGLAKKKIVSEIKWNVVSRGITNIDGEDKRAVKIKMFAYVVDE